MAAVSLFWNTNMAAVSLFWNTNVAAVTLNRNVIITYGFLAAPVHVQANRNFFYIDCMIVYFNCKYFP